MAIGLYSDFKIRDALFETAFIETIGQNLDVLNARSRGTIQMTTKLQQGHYGRDRFFDLPTGFISRRNIGDADTAVTPTAVTQDEHISVKVDRKFMFEQTLDSLRKIQFSEAEFSVLLGRAAANEYIKERLNTGLTALVAYMINQADLLHDFTGTGTLTHGALITGLSKFGDAADNILAWVQHSKPMFDLMAANVTVASGNVAGMTLVEGSIASINRPLLATDSTALKETITTPDYYTLGLVQGALMIEESEPPLVVTERVTGRENIAYRVHGEMSYNIKLKGASWDTANGGISPTNAALGTASNWDAVVARDKDKAGVVIQTT